MTFASDREIDKAYRPSAALAPGVFEANLALYRERSAEAYLSLPHERDLCYDPQQSGQCLDIFPAAGPELKPVFVFIHGGYWRMLSKNESTFMAGALTRRGISVVAVDYTLAPAVKLEEIVRQVRASIAWLYRNGSQYGIDPERIFVGGSSAGGHLTGAIVSGGWREAMGLPENVIKGAMPVSGIFDLAPLARSFVNEWMKFDDAQVQSLSPIHHLPPAPCKMVVAWGADETSGFHEQSHAWLAAWRGADFAGTDLMVPDRHHFDIVLDWCEPDSAMTRALSTMVLG